MPGDDRAGVLFDVDGTLVDTPYLHAVCWAEALRQAGVLLAPSNAAAARLAARIIHAHSNRAGHT